MDAPGRGGRACMSQVGVCGATKAMQPQALSVHPDSDNLLGSLAVAIRALNSFLLPSAAASAPQASPSHYGSRLMIRNFTCVLISGSVIESTLSFRAAATVDRAERHQRLIVFQLAKPFENTIYSLFSQLCWLSQIDFAYHRLK